MWFTKCVTVYASGEVCISILHSGDDPTQYEKSEERWSPIQSVEKILLSVMSMLSGNVLFFGSFTANQSPHLYLFAPLFCRAQL